MLPTDSDPVAAEPVDGPVVGFVVFEEAVLAFSVVIVAVATPEGKEWGISFFSLQVEPAG